MKTWQIELIENLEKSGYLETYRGLVNSHARSFFWYDRTIETKFVDLDRADNQTDTFLENLPPFANGKFKRLPRKRVTLNEGIEKFHKLFPLYFEDPKYIGDLKSGERAYKWAAHELSMTTLGCDQLEALLEAGEIDDLRIRTLAVEGRTNLMSIYEKAAFRDGLKDDAAAKKYFEALLIILSAPVINEASFEDYLLAVEGLPSGEGKTSLAKWPVRFPKGCYSISGMRTELLRFSRFRRNQCLMEHARSNMLEGAKIMKVKSWTVWIILLVPLMILAQEDETIKKENKVVQEKEALTPAQQALVKMWEEHTKAEFETKSTEDTLKTMVPGAHVNHVPVLTGGVGLEEVGEFYSRYFIPQMPPDTELTPVSRTIGTDQIVDEMIFKFTHTIAMAWMLPGIPPTGRRVEVPLVAIIKFQDGKVAHEHIYWDQASVLVQIGLLNSDKLPVAGIESARKVLNPASVPSNGLIKRK